MTEDSFTIKDLGATIAKMLGVEKGDSIELARSKIDPNRVLVIRHPDGELPEKCTPHVGGTA